MSPANELWILDGHNVLFAVPHLEEMVSGGAHEEARETLRERVTGFAGARGVRAVIVFDGVPQGGGGAAGTPVEVVFARHVEADDRIVHRAQEAVQAGKRPHVVTDDRELRERLHRNTAVVGAVDFWRLSTPSAGSVREKPTATDPDIAAHFLARDKASPERGTVEPVRRPEGDSRYRRAAAEGRTAPLAEPPTVIGPRDPESAPAASDREAGSSLRFPEPDPPPKPAAPDPGQVLAAKKERGRRKQARRLERTGNPRGGKSKKRRPR